jgi:hypothetical protein
LDKFSREIHENIGWYVYRLIDPTNAETFYVGKGKKNRVFQHAKLRLRADVDEDLKLERISKIHSLGLSPIYIIHRHGIPSEEAAFEVEAALIDSYPGLSNGVVGHGSGARGCMSAQQIKELYESPEADYQQRRIMMILINRSATDGRLLIDAASGNWKLKPDRASKAELVLAVIDGVIREVFCIGGPVVPVGDRWRLLLKPADDVARTEFSNKRIPAEFRKPGAANPIKYNYR